MTKQEQIQDLEKAIDRWQGIAVWGWLSAAALLIVIIFG
jgi:hypothetical protein